MACCSAQADIEPDAWGLAGERASVGGLHHPRRRRSRPRSRRRKVCVRSPRSGHNLDAGRDARRTEDADRRLDLRQTLEAGDELDMIWKIFHDSRDISPEDAVVPRASGKANGISGGAEAESFIFQA